MAEELQVNPVEKIISVRVDGKMRKIKMTYGLLNEVLEGVRDLSNVGSIFTDPEVRNKALNSILSERDEKGKLLNVVGPTDVEIEIEDLERVLSWVASHVTSFFVRSLSQLTRQLSLSIPETQEIDSTSSPSGTEA